MVCFTLWIMINFSVWGLILGDKFLVVNCRKYIVRVKVKINPREHIQNALCTGFSMFILQFDLHCVLDSQCLS
jgi:hypothetical protein